jgi:hypothetical protein
MVRVVSSVRTVPAKKGFQVTRRRRDHSTHWENEEPVSDLYELLALLKPKEEGDFRPHATRCLWARKPRPEVEVRLHGAVEGEDPLGYYEVDPTLARLAVDDRLVECGARGHDGIYQFDERKCVLSDRGRRLLGYLSEARKLLEKEAISAAYRAWGDGSNGAGIKPYVEFETAQGARMRICPVSKSIATTSLMKECA